MYYATHRLFVNNSLRLLYTVEVEQGRVVSFFSFDGERQSMIWIDGILLADTDALDGAVCRSGELSALTARHAADAEGGCLHAYSIEKRGEECLLRLLR